jgi:hypothetical protein
MKRTAINLLLLTMMISASGQERIDAIMLSGRYGFPASYENTYSQKAKETGSIISIIYGIPVSQNATWVISLNHFYFNVKGDPSIPAGNVNPIQLNGFIARTGLYQKFENGTGIQLLFAPRYMTDFKGGGKNNFQLGGIFLFEKSFNEDLRISFGAQYNQELFGPFLVPIIDLYWAVSPKWTISGMLPIYSKIAYQATDNLSLGFAHFGLVTSYYLGNSDYAGDYIERNCIDATLFARQRIKGNIYVELRAGQALGRNYQQFEGDQKIKFGIPLVYFDDNRTVKNTLFQGAPILELRLVYNVIKPK